MQLFLADFQINGDTLVLEDKDIISQMDKVLRFKIGSVFQIQKEFDQKIVRYEVQIDRRDDQSIFCKIQKEQSKAIADIVDGKSIVISMPNKRGKAELIVQKLSEIGIQNIYFWPSERSVITDKNDNKRARLEKISQEAVEQSRGWLLPKIEFISDISKLINKENDKDNNKEDNYVIVYDLNIGGSTSFDQQTNIKGQDILAIVGPEGGFTQKDYAQFGDEIHILGLGASVLRMETAAIVGGWLLKNKS